jgi:hypothetical protein
MSVSNHFLLIKNPKFKYKKNYKILHNLEMEDTGWTDMLVIEVISNTVKKWESNLTGHGPANFKKPYLSQGQRIIHWDPTKNRNFGAWSILTSAQNSAVIQSVLPCFRLSHYTSCTFMK